MRIDLLIDRIRRLLAGGTTRWAGGIHPVERQRVAFEQVRFLLPVFYWATLFIVQDMVYEQWAGWLATPSFDPIWSSAWVALTGPRVASYVIVIGTLTFTALAAIFPTRRVLRVLAFVAFFQFLSYVFSVDGKIFHSLHPWLFAAFFLGLIPDFDRTRDAATYTIGQRQRPLILFWAAQATAFFFYSMSGLLKMVAAVYQFGLGRVHAFHPDALALQVLHRIDARGIVPILGQYIADQPILGWLPYLAALYLELFAFVAVFRPRLHRFWGIAIALFHIGNALIMNITFTFNVLLLGLLFAMSPFRPEKNSVREIIEDLPIFGLLFRLVMKRRQ